MIMQSNPKEDKKVLIKAIQRIRYVINKPGKKKNPITIHIGQIVKCDPALAKEWLDENLAIDFDPEELKVIEI